MGSYANFHQWFATADSPSIREAKIAAQLDGFKAAGLRVVMPCVLTTSNVAFYPSKRVPNAYFGEWDGLEVLMRLARQRGLKVYPWIAVMNSGNERPKGVLAEHPEWALRDEAGQPTGFISPGHPQARDHVVGVITEVVERYRPDGILLDYLRYQTDEMRLDAVSEAEFDRLHPVDRLPRSGTAYRQADWAFKRQLLTELVGRISGEVRKLAPGMPIGIYMWHAGERKYTRDWTAWVDQGYIDQIHLRAYFYRKNEGERYLERLEEHFRVFLDVASVLRRPVDVMMTVGISTTYDSIRSAQEIDDYLDVGRAVGVKGVSFFTWEPLVPFLDDVKRERMFEEFTTAATGR